jgi:NhaC family Na+:H+ antiporter
MAGTDLFTHIKFMIVPTAIAYGITLVFFGFLGFHYASGNTDADTSAVVEMSKGLADNFTINPLLLLPPIIVIVAVAMKIPAIPGITLGIISGAIIGIIFQGGDCTLGDVLSCGYEGFTAHTGIKSVDELLTSGGIMNMMSSVSLTIIAMMFGGILEKTKQMEVLVGSILKRVKLPGTMVALTEATCVLSNVTMPEQYISIVVPGRMYADAYQKRGLHAKTLSNALESAGTVTSALVPWNTCGVFIAATLGIKAGAYFPYAIFNYTMPIICIVLAYLGITVANSQGVRLIKARKAQKAEGQK